MATTRHSTSGLEKGFRTFWKKVGKPEQGPDESAYTLDASGSNHRSQRSTGSISPTSDSQKAGNNQSEAQKRRQQVYQAQKRHRNRKAEYITSLEAEIARLRHLDAEVNSESQSLSHQNQAMRELLASQSLDAQLDSIDLSSRVVSVNNSNAALNMRHDEQLDQDRWFIDIMNDTPDMQWTSSETSEAEGQGAQAPATPAPGDSWAAMDFILALEHPCRNHVHHPIICPHGWQPEDGEPHGHAMTATAALLASAQAPAATNIPGPAVAEDWTIPHAEIEKLIELSQGLVIDDTDITPAQAYSAVLETVPNPAYLRPALHLLKQPLAKLVSCAHFGSTLNTATFWEHFSATIESLRFTRPELG